MALRLSKKAQKEFDKLNIGIKFLEGELQDLNIKYKYVLLDLEATKRENAYLKKLLDKGNLHIERVIKTEGLLRNALFTNKLLGYLIRFIRGPISDLVTLIDNIAIKLFGESNIYIVVSRDNSKKPS